MGIEAFIVLIPIFLGCISFESNVHVTVEGELVSTVTWKSFARTSDELNCCHCIMEVGCMLQ